MDIKDKYPNSKQEAFQNNLLHGKACESLTIQLLTSLGYEVKDISMDVEDGHYPPFDLVATHPVYPSFIVDVKQRANKQLWLPAHNLDKWCDYPSEHTKIVMFVYTRRSDEPGISGTSKGITYITVENLLKLAYHRKGKGTVHIDFKDTTQFIDRINI